MKHYNQLKKILAGSLILIGGLNCETKIDKEYLVSRHSFDKSIGIEGYTSEYIRTLFPSSPARADNERAMLINYWVMVNSQTVEKMGLNPKLMMEYHFEDSLKKSEGK